MAPGRCVVTQDVPLPELFRQAQRLAEQAAAMPAQSADTRARQAEALRTLARCDQLVDSLAFFSRCDTVCTSLSMLLQRNERGIAQSVTRVKLQHLSGGGAVAHTRFSFGACAPRVSYEIRSGRCNTSRRLRDAPNLSAII